MKIHMHKWRQDSDDSSIELDASYSGFYGEYVQFATTPTKVKYNPNVLEHYELRLSIADLQALADKFLP